MRAVQPQKLSVANFRPYGWALLKPERPLDIESPTLRYWHDLVDLSNLGQMGTMGFMQMKRVPVVCTILQCLPHSIEMYISLDGKPSVFFVAPARKDARLQPDEGRIEAFILEGGASVVVEKGIWHVAPFPLSETADFALGLRNTVILRTAGGLSVDEKEITYATLKEPVAIAI